MTNKTYDIKDDEALTAHDVKSILGVSLSFVYTLPIPCYYHNRARRWKRIDVINYRESCRSQKKTGVTASTLSASSPTGDFESHMENVESLVMRYWPLHSKHKWHVLHRLWQKKPRLNLHT